MWPAAPGAGSYEVEAVNFTSTDPAGPYTALTAASNQSRAAAAPTPGLRFVARVTAVGHDGDEGGGVSAGARHRCVRREGARRSPPGSCHARRRHSVSRTKPPSDELTSRGSVPLN